MATDTLRELDLNIAECLENCPELDAPLLDASFLDQLCLSDELWTKLEVPEVKGLCGSDGNLFGVHSTLQGCVELPGVTTPPQSPPDPSPSPASTSGPCSPQQQFPSCGGEQLQKQTDGTVEKESTSSVAPPVTGFAQMLKSGEVVYLQLPHQELPHQELPQQQPVRTTGQATPVKVPPASTSQESVKAELPAACIGQKRTHPDAELQADLSKLTRKQQRMMKNRESASISRQRKKEQLEGKQYERGQVVHVLYKIKYVQSLEARLMEAASKNDALLKENNLLRSQVSLLEKENLSLRSSLSQPSSPLSTLQKPTLVLIVVFCFAAFFIPRDVIHLPMRGPSPTTALTPTSHFGGRALLSVPNSGQQDRSLSSPAHRNSKRALIPGSVSTALSNLNHYLEKKIQATTVERKPHQNSSTGVNSSLVSSMCSCPAPDVANVTTMKRLNSELSQSFKWYEDRFVHLYRNQDIRQENSLALVDLADMKMLPQYHVAQSQDIPRLYEHFKKSFTRDFDNFYMIAFKDYLLLNAPLHNSSEPPLLSVVVPMDSGIYTSPPGHLPLLQIDCEVLDTKVIHMELPKSTV